MELAGGSRDEGKEKWEEGVWDGENREMRGRAEVWGYGRQAAL